MLATVRSSWACPACRFLGAGLVISPNPCRGQHPQNLVVVGGGTPESWAWSTANWLVRDCCRAQDRILPCTRRADQPWRVLRKSGLAVVTGSRSGLNALAMRSCTARRAEANSPRQLLGPRRAPHTTVGVDKLMLSMQAVHQVETVPHLHAKSGDWRLDWRAQLPTVPAPGKWGHKSFRANAAIHPCGPPPWFTDRGRGAGQRQQTRQGRLTHPAQFRSRRTAALELNPRRFCARLRPRDNHRRVGWQQCCRACRS